MRKCIKFTKINSTQDYAKRIAEKSPSGTIIVAEKQTKGRGQFERGWSSSKGGLYFSVILKPQIKPQKIPLITYKMALAIVSTLKKIAGKKHIFSVNPPNDVVVRPKFESCHRKSLSGVYSPKKIAGILTESSITCNKIDWIVVGVGVNINNKIPKNLKDLAISLKEITEKNYEPSIIFRELIKNLKKIKTGLIFSEN